MCARVHYELGLQYNQQGNIFDGEQQYRASLSIDDFYVPALYDLAEILLLARRYQRYQPHLLAVQQQGSHWVVFYRWLRSPVSEQDTDYGGEPQKSVERRYASQVLLDDKLQWQPHFEQSYGCFIDGMLLYALGCNSAHEGMQPTSQ